MKKALLALVCVIALVSSSASQGVLPPFVPLDFPNALGTGPNALGFVCTFQAGTSTLLDTYSNVGLTVANQNPVRLNVAGRPAFSGAEISMYMLPQAYKFSWYAAGGVGTPSCTNSSTMGSLIKTVDNVEPSNMYTVAFSTKLLDKVAHCSAYSGANGGAKAAAAIAALAATGGTADCSGLEGAQSSTQDIFAGVSKPVKLILAEGSIWTNTVAWNPTASYTFIDCQGATLKTASAITVLRWSLREGGARNCLLDGQNTAGSSGLRLAPANEAQTTTVTYTSFNNFENFVIQGFDNGVVLTTGPTVLGVQSDNQGSEFNHFTLRDNLRGVWLTQHPTDANAATPDVNYGKAITCYNTASRTNTCLQIDAGSYNKFEVDSGGMVNGSAPNGTPTAYYIAGDAPTSGADNNSNTIIGRAETNTRCINVTTTGGHYNRFEIDGQCDPTIVSDTGTATVIHNYPYISKNGLWYSYSSTTGIVQLGLGTSGIQVNPADNTHSSILISDATKAASSEIGSLSIRNSSDATKRLAIGYDTATGGANGSSWIQSVKNGTGATPLYLQPNGGPTVVGPSNAGGLGTPDNGSIQYCTDCQVTSGADNTCTNGGSGALAVRVNGAWRCFALQN